MFTLALIFVIWTIFSDICHLAMIKDERDTFNAFRSELDEIETDIEELKEEMGMSAFDSDGNVKV